MIQDELSWVEVEGRIDSSSSSEGEEHEEEHEVEHDLCAQHSTAPHGAVHLE